MTAPVPFPKALWVGASHIELLGTKTVEIPMNAMSKFCRTFTMLWISTIVQTAAIVQKPKELYYE